MVISEERYHPCGIVSFHSFLRRRRQVPTLHANRKPEVRHVFCVFASRMRLECFTPIDPAPPEGRVRQAAECTQTSSLRERLVLSQECSSAWSSVRNVGRFDVLDYHVWGALAALVGM